MKLSELKGLFVKELSQSYSHDETLSLFYMVSEHLLQKRKVDLIISQDFELEEQDLLQYKKIWERLKKGEPIQHIIGEVEFYRHKFKVNNHTLIPRPETEELIDLIKSEVGKASSIVDIGTGSGCIAISLASVYGDSSVLGVDISSEALKLASENADRNNLTVEFRELDFLKLLPAGKFDLIVSNPPYIAEGEKTLMSRNVLDFEPEKALFVKDDDPLIFYRHIADFAEGSLNQGGNIYMEINQRLGLETIGIFPDQIWNTRLYKDMSGNDRFVKAWRKE